MRKPFCRPDLKKTLFTGLIILLTTYTASCSKDVLDTTGDVSGIVTDSRSNEPLAGVSMTLSPSGKSVTTGANGRYEFTDIQAADYSIQANKANYQTDKKSVTITAGKTATVDFRLTPSVPILTLSKETLDFGNDATTLTVDIQNKGFSALQWQVSEDVPWLSCTPTSGTTQAGEKSSVIVNVNREGLSRGNYSQTIAFSSNGGSAIVTVKIGVQGLTVSVSPEELDFGSTTTSLQLTLTNSGTNMVSYTLTPSNDWIFLSKTSGMFSYSDNLTVSVNRAGFSVGDYKGNLLLTIADQSMEIPVKMNVPSKEQPTVTLQNVSNITFDAATFKGGIVSIGSSKVTKHGFCWGTEDSPTTANSSCNLGDCSSAKDFSYNVAQLKPGSKYYVRAYAENAEGISYSNQQTFETSEKPQAPQVETGSVSNIKVHQAQAAGNIVKLGNEQGITQYGHVWGTTANPTVANGKTELGATKSAGAYTSTLTGLTPGQTYHVRAYATNSLGTSYGQDVSFTTIPDAVSLTTVAATDITHNEATLGGSISDTGGNEITERGVCYATTANPTLSGSHKAANQASNRYTVRINGLQPLTQYHARAYVSTKAGETYYGNDVTFQTTHEIVPGKVAATTVSGIGTHAATFRSSITSDGDGTVSDCGFVYAKTSGATIDKNTRISCGAKQSGNLTSTVEKLSDNTTYYVRAYITNQAGTAYGEEVNFATLEVTVPTVSATTVSKPTHRSATFTASVTSNGNGTLTDAGFVFSISPNPGLTNHKISCGKSNSLSGRTTELTPNTTYYVRAYATNEKGTSFGNEVSFKTAEEPSGTNVDINDFGNEQDWSK